MIILLIGNGFSLMLGWIGSFAYLLAYLLLSLNKLKSDQKAYHILNIVGALGLTVNAIFIQDYPNVLVNIFWGLIALMAILLIVLKKRN
jgi:hypothetical protein